MTRDQQAPPNSTEASPIQSIAIAHPSPPSGLGQRGDLSRGPSSLPPPLPHAQRGDRHSLTTNRPTGQPAGQPTPPPSYQRHQISEQTWLSCPWRCGPSGCGAEGQEGPTTGPAVPEPLAALGLTFPHSRELCSSDILEQLSSSASNAAEMVREGGGGGGGGRAGGAERGWGEGGLGGKRGRQRAGGKGGREEKNRE